MSHTESSETSPYMCIGSLCFLAYQVAGIIYLIENYNTDDACISDDLSLYVLISLISALGQVITIMCPVWKIGTASIGIFIVFILTNIALAIWGISTMNDKFCYYEREYNSLWVFSGITLFLQLFSTIIYLLVGCCFLRLILCNDQPNSTDDYEEI